MIFFRSKKIPRRLGLSVLIGCFFLCSLCGCDIIYRFLDEEGAEEKEFLGPIVPPEQNPSVEEIQSLLKIYGYYPGKIDGILGPRTRDAIERFQKESGLKETRKVDQATVQKLNIFKENELIVDGRLNVTLIQSLLQKAGFNPGKIDGKLGPKTQAAIKAFQKDQSLKVDGKVGYQTLLRLSSFLPL